MVNDAGIYFILVIVLMIPILFFVFKKKKNKQNASQPSACDRDTCWWRK